MMEPMTPEMAAAVERIHNAIASERPLRPDLEEGQETFVESWVLVINYLDDHDGEAALVRVGSPNLLASHRDGLLWTALHGF